MDCFRICPDDLRERIDDSNRQGALEARGGMFNARDEVAFTPFQFEYPRLCIGVATISALNAIACPSALSTSSPRADWVTRLHCLRIDGDEGPRQRGGVGDREAAAR